MITNWRKSSYSGNPDGDCVEAGGELIGAVPVVGVRDTKNRDGAQLGFHGEAWTQFLAFAAAQ